MSSSLALCDCLRFICHSILRASMHSEGCVHSHRYSMTRPLTDRQAARRARALIDADRTHAAWHGSPRISVQLLGAQPTRSGPVPSCLPRPTAHHTRKYASNPNTNTAVNARTTLFSSRRCRVVGHMGISGRRGVVCARLRVCSSVAAEPSRAGRALCNLRMCWSEPKTSGGIRRRVDARLGLKQSMCAHALRQQHTHK
jgi:hypothetical protein